MGPGVNISSTALYDDNLAQFTGNIAPVSVSESPCVSNVTSVTRWQLSATVPSNKCLLPECQHCSTGHCHLSYCQYCQHWTSGTSQHLFLSICHVSINYCMWISHFQWIVSLLLQSVLNKVTLFWIGNFVSKEVTQDSPDNVD